ncbi:hypothetical protein NB11A_09290 [Ligilactobacillus agilis]|nr:hypothetical protein NB11A_09290 [Ligilactobacillus agilis]
MKNIKQTTEKIVRKTLLTSKSSKCFLFFYEPKNPILKQLKRKKVE